LSLLAGGAMAEGTDSVSTPPNAALRELVLPIPDPVRGRRLFVAKGCFVCHAIDGIGGMAAPALDAPEEIEQLNVLNFVARMWWGAQAMLELQNLELGYEIQLDGNEIADLAAFAYSTEAQRGLSMQEIPELLQSLMIDEPYWMGGDWPEPFRREYDENKLPFDY
jgi:cytochrome c